MAPLEQVWLEMAGVTPVQHWRLVVLLALPPVEHCDFAAQGPLVQAVFAIHPVVQLISVPVGPTSHWPRPKPGWAQSVEKEIRSGLS